MINKVIILIIGFLVFTTSITIAQDIDASKVDVSALSDAQVQKIITEMKKRGLSENEALNLARMRGMTNSQISLLQKRIAEVKLTGGLSTGKNSTQDSLLIKNSVLSTKAKIDSAMMDSKIFGFSFFNSENLSFEPSVNVPVSDNYILGTGDEIIIDVWGASQQTYQLEVSTNGDINIPLIGPIYLKGITLKSAKARIKNKLASIYSDLSKQNAKTFASISLGEIKAIRINVLGEVFAPGTYTVPGTATLFNVLYLSGGPNKQGSFRDIKLIRNGKVISSLDVYDFLINGNPLVNAPLMDDDIVMIPTYINRVKVAGEFKRNGIFEAIADESVDDMIKYAGGFTEKAYRSSVKLYRNNGKEKTFAEITPENADQVFMAAGDSLYVGKILDRFTNIVSIEGGVFSDGDYEYKEGLTLHQLIEKADGLIENAFLNRGIITRFKPDYTLESLSFNVSDVVNGLSDIPLKANDKVFISTINDLREKQSVSIWGEVQKNGVYSYAENLTIADLLLLSGGFTEAASESTIEVRRRLGYEVSDKSSDISSELFYFNISRDLKLDEEGSSFVLKPFDEVSVRQMPGAQSAGSVELIGEVMYGGKYNLTSEKERISDVLKRAGGLSANAYPEGATLVRKVRLTREEMAKRHEMMEKDSTLNFSDLDFENVSMHLQDILNNHGSKEDIYLRDGDVLRIPSTLQTVKISGEVLNPSSTVFEKGRSVKKYISMSGGFSFNAKKGKTYVLHANGASKATKGFIFFKKYPKVTPGSEVIVPKKPERVGMSPQAWIGIGSALASLSLTIVTIVNATN